MFVREITREVCLHVHRTVYIVNVPCLPLSGRCAIGALPMKYTGYCRPIMFCRARSHVVLRAVSAQSTLEVLLPRSCQQHRTRCSYLSTENSLSLRAVLLRIKWMWSCSSQAHVTQSICHMQTTYQLEQICQTKSAALRSSIMWIPSRPLECKSYPYQLYESVNRINVWTNCNICHTACIQIPWAIILVLYGKYTETSTTAAHFSLDLLVTIHSWWCVHLTLWTPLLDVLLQETTKVLASRELLKSSLLLEGTVAQTLLA